MNSLMVYDSNFLFRLIDTVNFKCLRAIWENELLELEMIQNAEIEIPLESTAVVKRVEMDRTCAKDFMPRISSLSL